MRRMPLACAGIAALLVAGFTACSDTTSPAGATVADSTLTADLADVSGDAIATDVADYVGNEVFGLSAYTTANAEATVTRSRTRTCYDANGGVVTCGQGLTASMVVTMQLDGSITGTHFSSVVHRARHDSISGLHDGDTQRIHNGFGSGSDTSTFTGDQVTRTAAVAATDTVTNLVFQLPHASNPWPVSGQLIRNVNATFTFSGARDVTRNVVRRVVVTFPADAEGNVSMQIGTMSCTLNLVTHAVTNCTGS